MSDEVETLVRRELDSVADQVAPRHEWTLTVLAGLGAQRAAKRQRQLYAVVAAAVLAAGLAVLVVGRDADGVQPAPEPDLPGPTMVDVGGRSLSLDCAGRSEVGDPTVIVDPGLGGDPATYDRVRSALVDRLRVCSYDRAGTGESHAADSFPRTARTVADDLARLVDSGQLGTSIVLVTDGFGGLSGAVFASDHPDLVSGLVFLDPRGPHVSRVELRALGSPTRGEPRLVTELRDAYLSDAFSRNGEQISVPRSEAEVAELLDAAGPAFGDTPTVVLRPALGEDALPPLPARIRSAWWDAARADQDLLAAESTGGAVREVADVSGSLADAAPAAVVAAVLDVAGLGT